MQLVIGNKNYSSWSLRPWLLLKQIGQPFEEVLIPLYEADSRARILEWSPAGKLPALIDDGLLVHDSLAITEYLAERFPQAGVWPAAREARARARCVCAEMHAGFAALRQHMPMNLRERLPGRGRTPAVEADIARVLALWQQCRAQFGAGGPFLFGHFTAADAFFAPVITRFATYAVELPPVAAAYCQAVLSLPAMQEWTAAAVAEPWRIAAAEPYAGEAAPA